MAKLQQIYSEISKSDYDAHVSDTSNNDLLGDMSFWPTLIFEKKNLIWDKRDLRGIKHPCPSGGRGPGRGFQGGRGGCGGRNGAVCRSAKDREIAALTKKLAKQSSCSINNVNSSKEDDVDVSTKFAQDNNKNKE